MVVYGVKYIFKFFLFLWTIKFPGAVYPKKKKTFFFATFYLISKTFVK